VARRHRRPCWPQSRSGAGHDVPGTAGF
jgi:hypothetical protein